MFTCVGFYPGPGSFQFTRPSLRLVPVLGPGRRAQLRRQQSTAKAFEVSPRSLRKPCCVIGLAGEEPWAAWEDPKVGIEELVKSAGSSGNAHLCCIETEIS